MVEKTVSKVEQEEEVVVNIQTVKGRVNYEKLIEQFGTEKITEHLLQRFEKVTGKQLHPWLQRGIFFSHRDFGKFLDAYENGEPVFLYTGRGPSSESMHIGHLIPFMFTKWLQDAFDCPLVIQLSDEEKYAFKKGTFQELYKMGWENAKDIVSCGFNPEKTFIFSNRDYRIACPKYEVFVSDLKVNASIKEVSKVFGFTDDGNVGMYDWPFYQSAASFSQAFPHIFGGRPAYCLIPCAIDQDPYFRLGRDLATKLNLLKTTTIYCTFLPPLTGMDGGKMSSSIGKEATLYLNDKPEVTLKKIKKYSKSGSKGNGTLEEHRALGGDVENDIACQYLRYFELDNNVLEADFTAFAKGDLTCAEMKQKLADKLVPIFQQVTSKRESVTDDELKEFYKIKSIPLPKPREKEKTPEQVEIEDYLTKNSIQYACTYHNPPVTDGDYQELRCHFEGNLAKVYLLYGQEKFYLLVNHLDTVFTADKVKPLAKKMGQKKLSLATIDTVRQILKCDPDFASVFGLINDKEKKISEIWIDERLNEDEKISFPPMRKDARLTISFDDLKKFAGLLNYELKKVSKEDK